MDHSGGSDSQSSVSETCGEADLKLCSFALLDIPKPAFTSRIWNLFDLEPYSSIQWNSEEEIRTQVLLAMKDIIEAAGLQSKIELKIELGIFRERPDLWVVMVSGFPIGVVQVKKPGENVMSNPKVWGQLYDYLLRLSSYYGLQHVNCNLTTN